MFSSIIHLRVPVSSLNYLLMIIFSDGAACNKQPQSVQSCRPREVGEGSGSGSESASRSDKESAQ
ncbi:hypothetical protein E2C01_018414 [Portunus trituberculatus]|uniref:Uncharacterized protein n=1 Tax=Portunus trituberculatus TaxID=210409 RepID=A0A5B7DV35_PORTR|nr:hypothetical protein [Portunus trituberculatus]